MTQTPQSQSRSCQSPAQNHKPSPPPTMGSHSATDLPALYSHGPSLAQADWHRIISDTSGYWQGDHCHTLGVGCIAEAFHLTAHLWPELSIDTVTLDQFTLPVIPARFHPHIPEPGVFTLMAFTAPLLVSFNYYPHL